PHARHWPMSHTMRVPVHSMVAVGQQLEPAAPHAVQWPDTHDNAVSHTAPAVQHGSPSRPQRALGPASLPTGASTPLASTGENASIVVPPSWSGPASLPIVVDEQLHPTRKIVARARASARACIAQRYHVTFTAWSV